MYPRLKTRWTRLYICLLWTGHIWDPLCKRNSLFVIINFLIFLLCIKIVKIKLLLSLQTVSRTHRSSTSYFTRRIKCPTAVQELRVLASPRSKPRYSFSVRKLRWWNSKEESSFFWSEVSLKAISCTLYNSRNTSDIFCMAHRSVNCSEITSGLIEFIRISCLHFIVEQQSFRF